MINFFCKMLPVAVKHTINMQDQMVHGEDLRTLQSCKTYTYVDQLM